MVEFTGKGWDNVSDSVFAAPPMPLIVRKVDGQTSVLEVHGAVIDELTERPQNGHRVIVKNLSTNTTFRAISGSEATDGHYSVTFVDLEANRAARAGDLLEVRLETPNPQIRVQPLRYVISSEEVYRNQIHLPDLIVAEIPDVTELRPNYPNPFNPETWLPFNLSRDADVAVTIYNAMGESIRRFDLGHMPAGSYLSQEKAVYWNGRNEWHERIASGVYYYTLEAGEFHQTRKMAILK